MSWTSCMNFLWLFTCVIDLKRLFSLLLSSVFCTYFWRWGLDWFVQKVTFALFYFETRIISEMHIYIPPPPWDCLFVCLLWRERNINVNLFSYTDDGIKEETFTVSGLLLLFLLSATWRRSTSELILPLYSTQSDKYSKRRALMTWT